MDRFSQMRNAQVFDSIKVSDGPGDLKDSIMRASGEALLLHRSLEESFGVGIEFAVGADLAGGHLGVGEDLVG